MKIDRDRLDDAIDHVAARMTAVREDDQMTARIVAALPEASLFQWWLRSAWAPRLAAVALVVIGAALWNRNGIERPELPEPSTVSRPSLHAALVAFAPVVSPVVPRVAARVAPDVPMAPMAPEAPMALDFERSLPALDTMSSLSLASLTPRELPERDALGLAPIEIGELALTTESFPQR